MKEVDLYLITHFLGCKIAEYFTILFLYPYGTTHFTYSKGIHFNRLNDKEGYLILSHFLIHLLDQVMNSRNNEWAAYGKSKLANILHANELARQLKVINLMCNSKQDSLSIVWFSLLLIASIFYFSCCHFHWSALFIFCWLARMWYVIFGFGSWTDLLCKWYEKIMWQYVIRI